jgi:opacity protein-like surface antigen
MRNLMIGAVSAVLLMAAPAMAQTAQSESPGAVKSSGAYDTAPSTSSGYTGPDGVVRNPPGATTSPSAGSSTGGVDMPGTSGSSGTYSNGSGSSMPGVTTAPSGMGNNTGSNIPRDNQTATGTHCPPGTPNCGPDQGGSQ